MTTLHILNSGVTTLQDRGRDSWQHLGVPQSGAWNMEAYEEASLLLSHDSTANIPMFEILAGTLRFTVEDGPIYFACVGNARLTVDGQSMPTGALLTTQRPHSRPVVVEVQHTGSGVAYLTVSGLTAPTVLGSVSTDTFSHLGPDPVKAGDVFTLASDILPNSVGKFLRPATSPLPSPIRVILHAEAGEFCSLQYSVQMSSRSGTRLTPCEPLTFSHESSRPSHPVSPGTIQIPPSGDPILLGPDSGVTGGYPTLGTVITADLPRVAGLPVGSLISFLPCTVEDAAKEYARYLTKRNTATVDVTHIQQMTSKSSVKKRKKQLS